jgi:hypothetical protein
MMVELALESNSTEPKGVWQDFGSVAAAFDPGAGAKFNAHFERMWGATEPSGATRGPKRALEGPPLHGDDWTAGLLEATGDLLCPLHVAPRHSIAYDECPQPRTCTA